MNIPPRPNVDWTALDGQDNSQRRFRIGDPREHYDITFEIPPGVGLKDIIAKYKYEEKMLGCAICGTTKHHSGAVAGLSNGAFTLVGSVCGPRFFGVKEWNEADKLFTRAERFHRLERIVRQITARQPMLLQELMALRAPFKEFHLFRKELGEAMGPMWQSLSEFLRRSDGALYIEEKIDAETRKAFQDAQKLANPEARVRAPEVERKMIGRLSGIDCFNTPSPRRTLEKAIDQLSDIRPLTSKLGGNPTARQLSNVNRSFLDALDMVDQAVRVYRSAALLFSQSDLIKLITWINATYGEDVATEMPENGLRIMKNGRDFDIVQCRLAKLKPDLLAFLSKMRTFQGEDDDENSD